VVCLGTGPSLTPADVDACSGRARVIAIKDAYHLAPWADVLYSGDERWWVHHAKSIAFEGRRYALVPHDPRFTRAVEDGRAQLLGLGKVLGLEIDPTKLALGNHSGYQAINLAVHLAGATRIVLLGYDMKASPDGRDNFFGAKPYAAKRPPYPFLGVFASIVEPLAALGATVVNASRDTALDVFPRVSLEEALA
jgi:hypothetical protein